MQPLSSRGWSVIESVQDTDTLMIALNGYVGKLPLAGLDSVEITDKRRDIEVKDPSGSVNVGYQSIQYRHNTHTTATLNMRKEHSLIGYKDLAAYLQGRVAGLKVVNTDTGVEIFIRGENNSFMGSQAALIIVDGTECLGFDQANGMVNVNDVERVDVIKDGEGYGSRGANGVVIITTKKGGASK